MRGNPHAAFDVAGAGNVARSRCCDTRITKRASNSEHKLRPKPARQSSTLPKRTMRRLTRISNRGRLIRLGKRADEAPSRCAGVLATA